MTLHCISNTLWQSSCIRSSNHQRLRQFLYNSGKHSTPRSALSSFAAFTYQIAHFIGIRTIAHRLRSNFPENTWKIYKIYLKFAKKNPVKTKSKRFVCRENWSELDRRDRVKPLSLPSIRVSETPEDQRIVANMQAFIGRAGPGRAGWVDGSDQPSPVSALCCMARGPGVHAGSSIGCHVDVPSILYSLVFWLFARNMMLEGCPKFEHQNSV